MKMKMCGFPALFCLSVMLLAGAPLWAEAAAPVYDYADLLDTGEEENLLTKISALEEEYDMNFVILTIDDAEGKTPTEYADDFYMDQGYYDNERKGGAIYLIDMDNREVRVEVAHDLQYYLTDSRADAVIDAGYDDVASGNYYDCFMKMLDRTVDFLEAGIPANQYRYNSETGEIERYRSITPVEAGVAAVAALIAGAAACIGVVTSYRKKFSTYKYPWRKKCSFQVRRENDQLVNKFVTSRRIPKDPPPDSGGGGGNVTTTHTSSGGGSFSGSGRSF
ncbi:MAG: TPM domain-containing protein [Eubacteriales bacterium]|nr:TPM domain-containing protein [Eubacteriales bacterium]